MFGDSKYNENQYEWEGKKILVAEDETPNYEFIVELLIDTGVEVDRAKDGHEVVDKIESGNTYDLILMDMRMPGMDGFEATRIIKEKNPDIVVFALTAFVQEEHKREMIEAGCEEIIEKPFTIDKVLHQLDKILKTKK